MGALNKYDIRLYSKARYTVENAMVRPKEPLEKHEQCGVIHECGCKVSEKLYVGETGRSLGERVEEHTKSLIKGDVKSTLSQHQLIQDIEWIISP